MKTLLIGGTDLTVSVAAQMQSGGILPCAAVGIGSEFKISYSVSPVQNARRADIGAWCRSAGVPYLESTDNKQIATFAAQHHAEFALVVGWYHMVPRWLREQFRLGVVGVHASLLPQLRGGAPLNWALLSGLETTGVTLFELSDGVDDGVIYMQSPIQIGPRATIAELVDEAKVATLDLVRQALPLIASGRLEAYPQRGIPTYGMQRAPEDGRISWRQSAEQIDRLVRAVGRPYPGAFTELAGQIIRIWAAHPTNIPVVLGAPGQIARLPEHEQSCIVTGDGLLVVEEASLDDGACALPLLRTSNNKRLSQS